MKNNRRKFLELSAMLAAGAVTFPQLACKDTAEGVKKAADTAAEMATEVKDIVAGDLDNFGIQLYTLRDIIEDDPQSVLKQLSDFGFTQIEGYDGPQGMFWNMGHLEFKKYMDVIGLDFVSSHVDINKDFEEKAAQAAEIGMKYLICPYIGPQTSMAKWKEVTDRFNTCGEICKKNGIKFAYHNHAYSFKAFSGQIPHDFIMENTDPELVDHEMDIYWVVTGGADPIEYLEKYPNRFKLCHVKDRMKDAGDERMASCNIGTGIIDFPKILKAAKANGMEYFIMEQERYDDTTPIDCAKHGADYLKSFKFA